MSNLIRPLSVKDTVLDISDSIDFAVFKSGQNITSQKYQANSQSNTQHTYAIQIPSVNTVLSRNIIWGADITFTISGTVQPYQYLWNSIPINQVNNGVTVQGADCFSPFILHSLTNTITCQLNNTSLVQNNVQQILDPILRGLRKEDVQKWYGSTPTQLDYWGSYNDALPQAVVSSSSLAQSVSLQQVPYIATWNSPFNQADFQNTKDLDSRASFEILSITGNTPAGSTADNRTVAIKVRTREPLILSPFVFNGDTDQTGLVGITQLNFTFSMDATAKRALRWVLSNTAGSTKQCIGVDYNQSAYMELTYYTPPPTMLIPATCCTPLQQFVDNVLPAAAPLPAGSSFSLTCNSQQLNSVPDKVIIWVDDFNKQNVANNATAGNCVADHYATITNVNITFNNQTGIMSTYSQKQLFDASLKSGSQQTFDEFSGLVNIGGYMAAGTELFNVGTCGSVLYLNFGDVINISEVYSAPGSLQVSQFQATVSFKNNTGVSILPQLHVMFLYSGVLTTTNGNSSSYLNGILTRNDVLNAANAPHMAKSELVRYVGSGLMSDVKAMAHNYLPMAKKMLQGLDNKYAKLGAQALDTLGYGKTGGVSSAGAMSAGRLTSKLM